MKYRLLTIALMCILLASLPSVLPDLTNQTLERTASPDGPQVKPNTAAYTPHAPIYITKDEDFNAQEWPGAGIEKDPFVIEGLNITSTGICINISDTKAVFEIRNCLLSSPEFCSNGAAVYFGNVQNGALKDCVIYRHEFLVYVRDSEFCNFDNNILRTGRNDARTHGFFLLRSSQCLLNNNNVTTSGSGLYGYNQSSYMLESCNECVLTNNDAEGSRWYPNCDGYVLLYSEYCKIVNCSIEFVGRNAFSVTESFRCELVECSAKYVYAGSGFFIGNSEECFVTDCSTLLGAYGFNLVNSLECNLTGSIATESGYDGFYLLTVDRCTLINNTAIDSGENGFLVQESFFSTVSNCTARNNKKSGFRFMNSLQLTIVRNVAAGNSLEPGVQTHAGLLLDGCVQCTLVSCIAFDNEAYGFYLHYSSECSLIGNKATDHMQSGFFVELSHSTVLIGNNAEGNYAGICLHYSHLCILTNNTAANNTYGGFLLSDSLSSTLTDNKVYDNDHYGVYIGGISRENILVHNWIGPNMINAQCDSERNIFDDGVSEGNHWSDYGGAGVYLVPGSGEAVDRFPFGMNPYIDHPADIEYEEGSNGHSITWRPCSLHPSSYELYITTPTGMGYGMGSWDGSDFTVSVDGLSLGAYSYRLVVYDTAGNSTSDTVIVTVVDTIPPTISSPADLVYESGTTGHEIVWTLQDMHLQSFSVTCNQIPVSGEWNGTSLMVSIDSLPLGVYNYTIIAYDTSNNYATDIVFVIVLDNTAPTIDRPADLCYEQGTTAHTLVWIPIDLNPASYSILRDGVVEASDDWDGSEIIISVDGLEAGSYNYTIVVYDTSGNSVSDQVNVNVSPSGMTTITTTTTTTTSDTTTGTPGGIDIMSMLLGGGIALAVVLVVIVVIKKK